MSGKLHTPFGDSPPPSKAEFLPSPHGYTFGMQHIEAGTTNEELFNTYLADPGADGWMVAHVYPPRPDGSYDILLQKQYVLRPVMPPRQGKGLHLPPGALG